MTIINELTTEDAGEEGGEASEAAVATETDAASEAAEPDSAEKKDG